MASRTLVCPECGLVDLVDTDRCPECGMTALDDSDPANRDAIDEAVALRQQRLTPKWLLPLMMVVFLGVFVAGAVAIDPAVGQLGGFVAMLVVMLAGTRIARARMPPRWKAALEWHADKTGEAALRDRMRFTSIRIAAAICLAFVGIVAIVGKPAVVFQRSDEFTRPWRIVTSMFAHIGPAHLIGNLLALFLFGTIIDLRVGRRATAAILGVAGVAGALTQATLSPEPMLGFSGAIYGLIGASLALMPTRPRLIAFQGGAFPVPTWLWMVLMIPLFTFTAWVDERTHVAWGAHLGGFFAGFLVALPMRRIPRSTEFELYEKRQRDRVERIASR